MKPIIEFVTNELQPGYLEDCPYFGGKVFVIGGIGSLQADMPQANALIICKGPGANKPCRFCYVHKSQLVTPLAEMDVEYKSRDSIKAVWQEMAHCPTKSRLEEKEKDTGILYQPNNPLYNDTLFFDPIQQVSIATPCHIMFSNSILIVTAVVP